MDMKALRIYGPCDMRLENVLVPEPKSDEVLIRIGATGICTTDIELYDGSMPYIHQGLTTLPLIPGHEWAGRIAKVGSQVERLEVGMPVVGDVSIGCGTCYNCMQGKYHLCDHRREVGIIQYEGGFAEYMIMPAKNVYPIPDGISLTEAALVETTATALHGVMLTGIHPGDRVVVFGDGSVGIQAAQAAVACGAGKVSIVARKWLNKDLIEKLGFTLLNKQEQDLSIELPKVLGGQADVVFEATGNSEVMDEAIHCVKPGGKVCALSILGKSSVPIDVDYLVTREISLIGSLASPNTFIPTMELIANGKIDVKPLITQTFPLERGVDAFEYVYKKQGPRIKVLVIQDI